MALQQGFSDSAMQGTPIVRVLRGAISRRGGIGRRGCPAGLRSTSPCFCVGFASPLQNYTSDSNLAALRHPVTGSVLSEPQLFSYTSSDTHVTKAHAVSLC